MREPLGTSGLKKRAMGAVESKHHANQATGRKVTPSTDVASTALGKKKWWYACRSFGKNSHKEGAI
jgi:hypothetical protein